LHASANLTAKSVATWLLLWPLRLDKFQVS